MVNTGGPSRGCVTCIQRKIRCDRQQPVCGQCQKSRRECGGYRSETDLMFRDQSQMVFTKALAALSDQATTTITTRNPEIPGFTDPSAVAYMAGIEADTSIMTRSPSLDEDKSLINFFANNFTCSDFNRGCNLFWTPSNLDDLLKEDCAKFSVQCVGAMALARLRRSGYYHRKAQRHYGAALLSLTRFWPQHVEVAKDAVLVAILFLGFFEILASYDASSRQSWVTHVQGMGLLLNKREDQFLNGPFGARMLLQSRNQAILNALQTKTPVIEAFRNPAPRVHHLMPPHLLHSNNADMLLIQLADLQAQYQASGPSNALVSDLGALETRFHRWADAAPSTWTFSTQLYERPTDLWWEVRRDVYPTALTANGWNKVRAATILVHDLVQEVASKLSSNCENRLDSASHRLLHSESPSPKIRNLVIDICATVPIYYWPSSAHAEADAVRDRPPLGTTYWLLWPLEVVGSMGEASVHLITWVRQCLERIYELTGNVKAQLVANRLRMKKNGAVLGAPDAHTTSASYTVDDL